MTAPVQTTARTSVRTDIQGLRAVAVSLVLVFHLAPESLTGGFVGVDVFFVISGFLITLHLLEHVPTGPRDLVRFWSRRVRRLLPASLLVLGVTLVASRALAPETQWANTAHQVRAAALYVLNWRLSADAVDYLASENAPSPVQHFWSLSVEEQFYFVWPVLLLLLALAARRLGRRPVPVVLGGLLVVVAGSLAYSIHLTATNPAAAYFVTPTRVWELGAGGILACATVLRPGRPRNRIAVPLAWAGFAAIAWTASGYTGSTPFPGWQAAVPVLGTAAVIAARSERGPGSPGHLLALPPVQWLGEVSYSAYLWHWPMVVLLPQVTGHALTWTDRSVVLVATLLLAALTKNFVEDPFRRPGWAVPLPKPFLVAVTAMALVVAGTGIQLTEVRHRVERAEAAVKKGLEGKNPCFGAGALDRPSSCPPVDYQFLVPAPLEAANDRSADYVVKENGHECRSYQPDYADRTCVFGETGADRNVVLVGNSHAGQWLPALQRLAGTDGFKITTMLASRCAFSSVRQTMATSAFTSACLRWVHRTTRKIVAMQPDLVVTANRMAGPAAGVPARLSSARYRTGYATVLRALSTAGIKVLVLRDTPTPGFAVPDCVATKQTEFHQCDGTRDSWLPPDPARRAVRALGSPLVRFADMTDHICGPETCSGVTGGVIAYFDWSHLSATFAATLAPYLQPSLRALLKLPESRHGNGPTLSAAGGVG